MRRVRVEPVRELVLADVEPRAEDEPQVVERGEPTVELTGVEAVAAGGLRQGAEVLEAKRFQLGAHERAVLALDLLVLVRSRTEAPERRILGLRRKQLLELGGESAQKVALVRAEVDAKVTVHGALDRCGRLGQSWRSVAQSPCAWRRATSCSAFSRVPLETTALPSWWTCSMSSVALARL